LKLLVNPDNTHPRIQLLRAHADSPQQVIDLLKTIAGKSMLVVPRGKDSRSIPLPVTDRQLVELDLTRLNKVYRFEPADFYIDCEAGLELNDLHRLLCEKDLVFPFLTAGCAGTVGGMVSTGQLVCGEECFNISRWVPALTVIMGDGALIKTGAVTFKSVAGYDLPKLFCGSFGTLGVITSVTLRCFPTTGKPYGKDTEPVALRIPRLSDADNQPPANDKTDQVVRRIKQAFDPENIFAAIIGWNGR
jgi:FAD/FMN-containing dehydrogenase